jgi:hypothetical protein
VQEYNERKNKKLVGNLMMNEEPKFWLTSSRPSNFGDHLDVKTKADNWFDENRYIKVRLSYLDSGMRKIRTTKLKEPRCIWCKDSLFLHIYSELSQFALLFINK